MSDYKIERNIPVAPVLNRTLAFPLDDMNIGDSFVMKLVDRNRLTSATTQRRRTNLPGKFVTRKINDTEIRVWRVE